MPTDPSISLQIGKGVQPILGPLTQQTAATNLIAQRQAVQSGALGIQQQKLDMSSDAAGRKLFSDALASGKDPSDNDILATYGAAKGTVILKNRMDAAKMGADLQDTRGKIAVQQSDYAGAGGKFIDAAGNDPVAFLQFANGAVRDKHIDPALAQPYIDHVTELMQQDPTGAAAKEAVAKITASWMQRSSEQGKLATEKKAADARARIAQTGADKFTADQPGIIEDARRKSFDNAARTYAANPPTDQPSYNAWIAGQGDEVKKTVPAKFDDKTAARVQALGMSADQQAVTAQNAANAENNVSEMKLELRAAKGDPDAKAALADMTKRRMQVSAAGRALAVDRGTDREIAQYGKPFDDMVKGSDAQLDKILDAEKMVAGGAVNQAMAIPKILSALVGGQGSGLRINEAELKRIETARGFVGGVEGFLNKISGNGTLTAEQKTQMNGLLDDVRQNLIQKKMIARGASDEMLAATNRGDVIAAAKKGRDALDAYASTRGGQGPGAGGQGPGNAPSAAVKTALSGAKPGVHTLSDGSKWKLDAAGAITSAK